MVAQARLPHACGGEPRHSARTILYAEGVEAPASGEIWLLSQDEETVARVLGPTGRPDGEAARALRSREVRLSDFVREERSKAWGVTRRAGTLSQAKEAAGEATKLRLAGKRGFLAEGIAWMPGVPDPRGVPSLARLEMDTRQIVRLVERESGLASRWKGIVRVETRPGVEWLGRKESACPIAFHREVIGDVEMYYVALEEALHSVSVILPATREEAERLRSVEEAVVGACLELLKPDLRRLFRFDPLRKVPLLPDTQRPRRYDSHMRALGLLRQRAGMEPHPFYWALLATPLTQRQERVAGWIAAYESQAAEAVAADPVVSSLWEQVEQD